MILGTLSLAMLAEMDRLYSGVLAGLDPEWKALLNHQPLAGGGGKPGNLASNSALESPRASIASSAEFPGFHSFPENTQAPPFRTQGSPSRVPYFRSILARSVRQVPRLDVKF
jgi:hypothetical protein